MNPSVVPPRRLKHRESSKFKIEAEGKANGRSGTKSTKNEIYFSGAWHRQVIMVCTNQSLEEKISDKCIFYHHRGMV